MCCRGGRVDMFCCSVSPATEPFGLVVQVNVALAIYSTPEKEEEVRARAGRSGQDGAQPACGFRAHVF